ncbi:hypothetical protein ACYSNR_03115 [Enterococcus sp. LJL128]
MVEKYFEMQMSRLENPIVKKMGLFLNGITVTQNDSGMELLLYQEPFSDVVVMVVYDENHEEIRTDRFCYRKEKDDWIVLPPKERQEMADDQNEEKNY